MHMYDNYAVSYYYSMYGVTASYKATQTVRECSY